VRSWPVVAAIARRDGRFHGRGLRDGLRRAARDSLIVHVLAAFAAGLVFGLGLIVSGMADPSRVLGFLDLAGKWDPSLAFVMAGAVAVSAVAFRLAGKRATPVLGGAFHLPTARQIDRRLVVGGLVFGVGWGLAGFCPGPAVVTYGAGQFKAVVFIAAMLAGMGIYEVVERRRNKVMK
jgi:uncharacterized membrane protein YedE/YeeE